MGENDQLPETGAPEAASAYREDRGDAYRAAGQWPAYQDEVAAPPAVSRQIGTEAPGGWAGRLRRTLVLTAAGVVLTASGGWAGATLATQSIRNVSPVVAVPPDAPAPEGAGELVDVVRQAQFGVYTVIAAEPAADAEQEEGGPEEGGPEVEGDGGSDEDSGAADGSATPDEGADADDGEDGEGGGPGRSGSAVAYRSDGLLVTNYHVVGDSGQVTLLDHTGRALTGRVLGGDLAVDISVIRVEGPIPVPRWTARRPQQGEQVAVIGSPFGFGGTVTSGVISAVDRAVGTVNGAALYGMIQTDAPMNPGNSGGALVDMSGSVIGVSTAIYSTSGQTQGVGFVIPAGTVAAVADAIASTGSWAGGFLGVIVSDGERPGAYVQEVAAGLPAAEAGLTAGDVVVAVDGMPVRTAGELGGRLAAIPAGTRVRLEIDTATGSRDVSVTLGARGQATVAG